MKIAISALQRNAAEVVRQVVKSGLPAEITDRGRVVAILSAPWPARGLERLRESGSTRRSNPEALARALSPETQLPSLDLVGALEQLRDDER